MRWENCENMDTLLQRNGKKRNLWKGTLH